MKKSTTTRFRRLATPPWVEQYIEYRKLDWRSPVTSYSVRRILTCFHNWLKLHDIKFQRLSRKDVREFLDNPTLYRRSKVSPRTKYSVVKQVARYIHWLAKEGKIEADFDYLFPGYKAPYLRVSPKELFNFLRSRHVIFSRDTLQGYKADLLAFHDFLRKSGKKVKDIDRRTIEDYLVVLSELPVSINYRRTQILHLRTYIRYLHENGLVGADPERLITYFDIPKLIHQLPRPLPPDIDKKIQTRLMRGKDLYSRALLLMRWTGLRISEVTTLRYDCIRHDYTGHKFMKVEVGKTKSERLVPIDDKILEHIQAMQKQALRFAKENGIEGHPEKLMFDRYKRRGMVFLMRKKLREITQDIKTEKKIVAHQFRHSHATELLNAGMSLPSLMRCLGHRDISMTLVYSAVTQESVKREYFDALKKLEGQYQLPATSPGLLEAEATAEKIPIGELPSFLNKDLSIRKRISAKQLYSLLKRIRRLQSELQAIGGTHRV